jgi:signal transduction histidine kinase
MSSEPTWPVNGPPLDARPSVLLVDDDPDVAHALSNLLGHDQYAVAIATSAAQALELLSPNSYDVVLMELALAEMDGLDLLSAVRNRAPATCCIVLTGYASLESAVAALRRGAYDYLVKPCVIEDLEQTLLRAVSQRRLTLLAAQREQQLKELNDQLEERVQERTAELRQVNQRLAEANASKDRFLATLSHELRTPLTPLRAGLDLLKERLADNDVRPVLSAMERNLAQEAHLIDDLLDIASISAGKLSLNKQTVDVASRLQATLEVVQPRAAAKHQTFTLDLRNPISPLSADPVRLQQVVTNLLDNAVKFSPVGGAITLSAWLAGGQVFIQVTDNGPGIPPAFLPHLFQPFWQADASSRRKHGGLGLGLAIAHQIALQHGGDLTAANAAPGPGACFTFRFPFASAEPAAPAAAHPAPHSLRVLLVDDSQDTIQVLGWLLSAKGLQVGQAASVDNALEAARAETPDVIITDIGMPGQDGYDLLRLVRADSRLKDIPVVAATGYVGSKEQEQMAEAGFAASLSKPFDLDELLVTLERVCPRNAGPS